jgi:RNA polymerase sigma-70 factor (ECF subfamily)
MIVQLEPQHPYTPGAAAEPDHLALLLEGCRRHDRLSQEKLYMHFFDKMLAVVKRTFPDQDAAISILNNGFLKAFTKIGQYSGSGSFEGWLRRIIHHAAADYFREHQRQLETAELPQHLPLADGQDEAAYKELLQLLQYLPPATRMVINLFVIEGYSHKEIGAMLGISTGTSKWHVSEGKRLLKELVNQQHERTRTGY